MLTAVANASNTNLALLELMKESEFEVEPVSLTSQVRNARPLRT